MNRKGAEALIELLDRVSATPGDLLDAIDDAVAVTHGVLGGDGAGVLLLAPDGAFKLVGLANEHVAALERGQRELGDGPGLEATRTAAPVSVADLREEPRWHALAGPKVRGVTAAPVWFLGRPAGSLVALSRRRRWWTAEDAQALAAYAGVITGLLRDAPADDPLVEELRMSLEARA